MDVTFCNFIDIIFNIFEFGLTLYKHNLYWRKRIELALQNNLMQYIF